MGKYGISFERAGVSIYPFDGDGGMSFQEACEEAMDWWNALAIEGEDAFKTHWHETSVESPE